MIDVGQQLGGYTILQRIGRGGMGDVFLAQHRRVARRAAVKVLIPELSQKATVLDRFFNEARATSLIKHPGIVDVLDCDVVDGQAFIIMEFLDGESLGAYLHRAGPLPADLGFFLGVGRAVAGAVGAAHAAGIIHRDLKPDNVYLHLARAADPTVTVKVLDFGIAKLLQQDGAPSHTSSGMLLGTPAYMSPEQCRGAGRVDARSDIYSLGCILYEALLGSPPFVREGMGDLIIAHVSEQPEPPAARIAGLAAAVNSLVLRMLAKNAADRPATMDAVVEELDGCARVLGIAIEPALRPRTPVERPADVVGGGGALAEDLSSPGGQRQPPTPPASGAGGTLPLRHPGELAGGVRARSRQARAATPGDGPRSWGGQPSDSAPPLEATRDLDPARRAGAAGGTAFERVEPTTLGSSATEMGKLSPPLGARSPRRLLVVGVAGTALLAVGGLVAFVATRSASGERAVEPRADVAPPGAESKAATGGAGGVTTAAAATDLAPPDGASSARAREPTREPTLMPSAAAVAEGKGATPLVDEQPDNVRVDIRGVPLDTAVTVDGRRASLPLLLPHGAASHRIVLRPLNAPERVLHVDGTKDRFIDLVTNEVAPTSAARDATREHAVPKAPVPRPPRALGAAAKKPPARPLDRDAITDI